MTAVEEAAHVADVVRRAEVEEVGTCTPMHQAAFAWLQRQFKSQESNMAQAVSAVTVVVAEELAAVREVVEALRVAVVLPVVVAVAARRAAQRVVRRSSLYAYHPTVTARLYATSS